MDNTTVSLPKSNADIIHVLTKLGFYLERNKVNLEKLSHAEQNKQLQKAFDLAVENCAILPLLFSKQELSAKLVLEGRPEWIDWRENRKGIISKYMSMVKSNMTEQETMDLRMKGLVEGLGPHSIWGPFRMGRYSVTESAMIQGASVRLKDDIPEMETLIMRFLSISVSLDTKGSNFPGCYWSITHIPAKHNGDNAHLPIPPTRSAVMAIQPLNVYQIDLPEDIDSADNESGELEMKRVGYVGNTNRRAIPIILVRYATALPGFGSSKAVKALIDHCGILAGSQTPDASYVTPTQLSLLTRLLESNSRRLAPSEIKKYQSQVPKHVRRETSISFISPLYCPSSEVADKIETGRKRRLACAVCGKEDTKLFYCSACSGIAYCSTEHQTADWSSFHKSECRSANTAKLPQGHHADPSDPSTPMVRATLPVYRVLVNSDGYSFVNYCNPMERIKPLSKAVQRSQCAKTLYARGERFLVRARWGGHADRMFGVQEKDRLSGKRLLSPNPKFQTIMDMHMSIIHVLDRPVSISILIQKKVGTVQSISQTSPGDNLEEDNSKLFDAIVEIIKHSGIDKAESAYFWAKRLGDCIELDLVDIPDQSLGW